MAHLDTAGSSSAKVRIAASAKYLEVDGHVEAGDDCRFRNNVILRTKGDGKIIFGTRSIAVISAFSKRPSSSRSATSLGLAEFSVVRDTNHLVWGPPPIGV